MIGVKKATKERRPDKPMSLGWLGGWTRSMGEDGCDDMARTDASRKFGAPLTAYPIRCRT